GNHAHLLEDDCGRFCRTTRPRQFQERNAGDGYCLRRPAGDPTARRGNGGVEPVRITIVRVRHVRAHLSPKHSPQVYSAARPASRGSERKILRSDTSRRVALVRARGSGIIASWVVAESSPEVRIEERLVRAAVTVAHGDVSNISFRTDYPDPQPAD